MLVAVVSRKLDAWREPCVRDPGLGKIQSTETAHLSTVQRGGEAYRSAENPCLRALRRMRVSQCIQRLRWGATVLLLGAGLLAAGQCVARAMPSTQTVRGEVLDEKDAPIPVALCTLTGRLLPPDGLTTTTDRKGHFEFSGLQPAVYSLVCAAAGHEPLKRVLEVTDVPPPEFQMVLPPEVVLHQTLEVREKAATVSTEQGAPSAKLGGAQISTLPLVEQKFKAALPYLPGVIRTPDGKINIKGAPESQGLLLVNSAETSDPVTGSQAIDIPVLAIDSLRVYKNAYDAQYGGFTGGLTTIHTRPPADQWKFEMQNLTPNPRIKNGSLVGMANFNPRVYVSGPLLVNRLSFSEALGYDIDKQPVRGLAWPNNEIRTHDFNSFTDFHYIFSPHHLAAVTANVFPLYRQYANINSLVPQTASSDYGQHGFKITITDQYITTGGGIFTTLVDGMQFDSWGHGQGAADMLVTPNGWGGNFFNAYQHDSEQEQFTETYKLPPLKRWGKHEWTLGVDLLNRTYEGSIQSHTVNVLRPDGSLAEEINFLGSGMPAVRDFEASLFVADHWVPSEQLSVDLGLRYVGQTLGSALNMAPRLGVAYSPGRGGKTVFRGGLGRFFAHTPLLAGDFTNNLNRQAGFFDDQGYSQGPPVTFVNAYGIHNPQGELVASPTFPGNVPYNWSWSLEADRELHPRVVLRLSYISSRAYDQFIVNPVAGPATPPAMLLTPHGASVYKEFESTVHIRLTEVSELNVSYVHSRARGDLNSLADLFVPFEAPVIRLNAYTNLASDVPNRIVTWGRFKTHVWGIEAGPVVDYHSGFPYSPVDVLQNYVGTPNTKRFPQFFSLDLKLSKEFRLPFPIIKKHLMRGSLTIFNLTDHTNPRDVYNNISSPYFNHFVGNQHIFLDSALDVLY